MAPLTASTAAPTTYESRLAAACAMDAGDSSDEEDEEEDDDQDEDEDEEEQSDDQDQRQADTAAAPAAGSRDRGLPVAVAALLTRSAQARRDSVELRSHLTQPRDQLSRSTTTTILTTSYTPSAAGQYAYARRAPTADSLTAEDQLANYANRRRAATSLLHLDKFTSGRVSATLARSGSDRSVAGNASPRLTVIKLECVSCPVRSTMVNASVT